MWHLWAHVGSDGRANVSTFGCADNVCSVAIADVAAELHADESPDLGADELADGSSIARSDVAPYTYTNAATDTKTDVFAQSTAGAGALAPALARADGCPVA